MKSRRGIGGAGQAHILAITSGKGGVGKTNLTANLAVALAQFGSRVAALDGDYGLGNLDLVFGLQPVRTLESVVAGHAGLADIALEATAGVRVLPSVSGAPELSFLSNEQRGRLVAAVREYASEVDFLLVDTATGISENTLSWLELADEILVLSSAEPTSIVDAYAITKLVSRLPGKRATSLVVNSVQDEREAREVHERLQATAQEFLRIEIEYLGHILRDAALAEALRQQIPILALLPHSNASRGFKRIARRLLACRPGRITEHAGQERELLEAGR